MNCHDTAFLSDTWIYYWQNTGRFTHGCHTTIWLELKEHPDVWFLQIANWDETPQFRNYPCHYNACAVHFVRPVARQWFRSFPWFHALERITEPKALTEWFEQASGTDAWDQIVASLKPVVCTCYHPFGNTAAKPNFSMKYWRNSTRQGLA